ncbi:MAG: hypothetical protein RSC30_03725 [Oscillospiraceae bacterium]
MALKNSVNNSNEVIIASTPPISQMGKSLKASAMKSAMKRAMKKGNEKGNEKVY